MIATNRMKIAIGENFKDIGAEFQILQAELMTELAPTVGETCENSCKWIESFSRRN